MNGAQFVQSALTFRVVERAKRTLALTGSSVVRTSLTRCQSSKRACAAQHDAAQDFQKIC
jgi:hypothetical protein